MAPADKTKQLQEALNALSPLHAPEAPLPSQDVDAETLKDHIQNSLASAKVIIDSLPTSSSATNETRVDDWKSQSGGKQFDLYKLNIKNGGGAWFARRSVVSDVKFDRFKRGLQLEFGYANGEEKDGGRKESVRGIGVDRLIEGKQCDYGRVDVYHLKAQFPGPSAPRDFVTCCITSHAPHPGEEESNPRHFTMISRPLRDHPETGTEKPGFVRGEYESIEFIRELSPRHPATQRPSVDGDKLEPGHEKNPPIEWIMVTRSNPGGSVPKWMVERGTPGSIVQDAEKFLNWVSLPRPELATPRPSQIGERPTEAEFTSGAPQRTISPEEADPEGQHEPTPGIVPATVSSVLSAIGSAASAVENVAAGAVHTVLGEGEKEEQPKEDVGRPSRPALARADTSVASFYSFEDESTEPGNRTPTPSSSTMSLNKEVVQAISQDEQAALERHLENEEKLKEKADREIEKVAKEAQAAAEAAAQKTQATTPLSETGSAQTDLSDAPPTKEQKKAIKLQWKLKERRQKVHERLQKDLAKEESRFQKEVEKIKKKHLKQAQKEKEHDESKKSSKQEAEVVAPSAEEEISSLESIASERHQFGGIRTPSIRSLARRKGDWANAEKEELRNVVKGLTLEVVQLRKRINELEDENRRLKGEEKAEDSGADLKSARSGEEVTVSFV